ncbi:hypothetical protein Tamer19_38180 [Cupriavidus sp. TA19]|uniref:hypothetical protein n=1 Tax=unclassified Cupriavidus TaxID=2640874 RepID=UPI0011C0EE15|nr:MULTISPECIES: hypothetical protein [unclassified Cupriavidus]BDB29718.1 hypothetical protein CTP10_R71330 [Cupriavidus sp. P-10]GLC94410.1 hypothetical protein Tamer19_38180 [Cupriavidus sp. TA19]
MLKKITMAVLILGTSAYTLAVDAVEYSVGQHVEVRGRLSLRGNAPFTYWVIHTRSGVVWVLDGVDPDAVKPMLGEQVQVGGVVSRADEDQTRLPVIEVDTMRSAQP